VRFSATLDTVDADVAAEVIGDRGVRGLADDVQEDAAAAMGTHAIRALLIGFAGILLAAALVYRSRWRAVRRTAVAGVVVMALLAAGTFATFRADAFVQARYTGSLRAARDLLGPLRDAGSRLEGFRGELDRLVRGTMRAYGVLGQVPSPGDRVFLHVSDIHASPLGMDFAGRLAEEFDVDAVLDTGDLVTFGTVPESLIFDRIPQFEVPYVFVRGNHDAPSVGTRVEAFENADTLEFESVEVGGVWIYGAPHPLYTPGGPMEEDEAVADAVAAAGEELAARVAAEEEPPDLVMVHDGRMGDALLGTVPLILSGHFHDFAATAEQGTIRLRTGTTGGGGFDTFAEDEPVPLAAQLLYLTGSPPRLTAVDRVALDPETRQITLARELVEGSAFEPTASPTPTPSP
jgi:predicted phosphodiesterase